MAIRISKSLATSKGFTLAAAGLALSATFLGLKYGTYIAGGSDSYGYVSQADLLYDGRFVVDQPWVKDVPWPGGQWVFAPLGYRPAWGRQSVAIAPTYSPGLPMLMAAARGVGGRCAVFWVVPLAGGLLVLATFGLGRATGSPGAGLIAAAMVLVSPVFLFMLMAPMTDVPVAAAWAASLWLLLGSAQASTPGRTTARVLVAGVVAAIAILIRPNLAGGLVALALWFPLRAWRDGPGRRARPLLDGLVFALASAAGVTAVALINRQLYGSALTSGYGGVGGLFDSANVWPNLTMYFGWFAESQTVWPLLGLAAFLAPVTVFWPGARDRAAIVVLGAFAFVMTGSYLVYGVYDAWWYLRFLLPVWPVLMLGFAAVVLAVARRGRVVAVLTAAALVWLGARDVIFARDHSVFRLWKEDRRYASVGRLVRAATEPSSVIFAIQHSGSIRHYAGRLTIRFDSVDDAWLDRTIAWLSERGIASYLVIEDWELPRFRGKFRTQQAVDRAAAPPIVEYTGPATVRLYDLRTQRDPLAAVARIAEQWHGPRCQVPADGLPGKPWN